MSSATKTAIGLKVRHDHGSQFMSEDYQEELKFLGIASQMGTVSRKGSIRTLKEQLMGVRRFATVEELRLALLEFKNKYNRKWLLEKHGYRTPAQVRTDFTAEAVAGRRLGQVCVILTAVESGVLVALSASQ